MSKPAPLTDDQIDRFILAHSNDGYDVSAHSLCEAIADARDAQWQEMLSKQEPVAWTTRGQIAAMENGFRHYIEGRVPRFVSPTEDDVPLYAHPVSEDSTPIERKE